MKLPAWLTWQAIGWLHAANCIGLIIMWGMTKDELLIMVAIFSAGVAIICWILEDKQ